MASNPATDFLASSTLSSSIEKFLSAAWYVTSTGQITALILTGVFQLVS
jgi:3-deoxy-D-arabino-heptulosonate 7-phosphate (DAHP) synthase